MLDTQKSKLQQLDQTNCLLQDLSVFVKRDDLIDDLVSGNKWRKLKYNILAAQANRNETLVTFGGAYSNHLVATAKACQLSYIQSVGIVRGDELNPSSNSTLRLCHEFGMKMIFVSRDEYQMRDDKSYIEQLHIDFPNSFIVPEGGANFYGLSGCQELWAELPKDFTDVVVAAGTGTTAAGLLSGMPEHMNLHVFSALKGDFMALGIERKLNFGFHNAEFTHACMSRLKVYDENVFGGYGKHTPILIEFMKFVKNEFNLPLDQVYTAKAFYGLFQMIQSGQFKKNSKILFIHTGGLQGNTVLT